MKKPTQKQIDEWKAKHGGVRRMVLDDGLECYLKEPDMSDWKRAMAALQDEGEIAFSEALLDALWLDGDEAIKKDEASFDAAGKKLKSLLIYPDADVQKHDDRVEIIVNGKKAVVKLVNRGHLKLAEKRNPQGKPFVDKQELFKIVKIEADPEFNDPNNAEYRMPLYMALDNTQQKKYASLEKL